MSFKPQHYTLAATSLGSSLAFIDATAVIVALPVMQKALGLGLAGQQWIFLSYSLALASLYLIGGALGDRYGYQKVFSFGVVGFALASVLAGLAPDSATIIIARVLQGVSGAFVTTNSLAWLRNAYGENSGKAVGLWTSLTGISTIIAPLLGGIFAQWLSWRLIFFINIPLAVLVIYWAAKGEKDVVRPSTKKPLDIWGGGLIALSFGFLVYYLVQGAESGFGPIWWALAIGVTSLVSFVLVELRIKHPMLPFELFKIRNFSIANIETLLIYGALYGVFVYFVLYLQFLGLSPIVSSIFLVPTSVVLILLAAYFGAMSDKRGPRLLLSVGPALIGLAAIFLSLIQSKSDVWLWGSIGLALFSLGLAMLVAPITSVALKSAPAQFAGLASGINNTMSRLGSLITVAVIGVIISLVFVGSGGSKDSVALETNQEDPVLRTASEKGFKTGMLVIAGLAFSAAAVGAVGFKSQEPVGKPARARVTK